MNKTQTAGFSKEDFYAWLDMLYIDVKLSPFQKMLSGVKPCNKVQSRLLTKRFAPKSLVKPIREQSKADIHTTTGNNLKDVSMCTVKLVVPSKKSFVSQIACIVFGTADEDIWGIINGFSRNDEAKELTAARVRGFIFSQLTTAEKTAFMSSVGHHHDMEKYFQHMLVTKPLNVTARKQLSKWMANTTNVTALANYKAAVEAIKNVYGYDLLKEKKTK